MAEDCHVSRSRGGCHGSKGHESSFVEIGGRDVAGGCVELGVGSECEQNACTKKMYQRRCVRGRVGLHLKSSHPSPTKQRAIHIPSAPNPTSKHAGHLVLSTMCMRIHTFTYTEDDHVIQTSLYTFSSSFIVYSYFYIYNNNN